MQQCQFACGGGWRGLALGAAVLVLAAGQAAAQQPPTYAQRIKEGELLAERLCRSCHVVGNLPDGTATAGIPSLRGIAARKDQTAERIRQILINPHPPMPDVRLSNPEIDQLIAYIDSLRPESAGKPLVPRGSSGKPIYPDPT